MHLPVILHCPNQEMSRCGSTHVLNLRCYWCPKCLRPGALVCTQTLASIYPAEHALPRRNASVLYHYKQSIHAPVIQPEPYPGCSNLCHDHPTFHALPPLLLHSALPNRPETISSTAQTPLRIAVFLHGQIFLSREHADITLSPAWGQQAIIISGCRPALNSIL